MMNKGLAVFLFSIMGILIGYVTVTQPESVVLLPIVSIFLLAISAVLKSRRMALDVAIFCLPFTQVPTIKLFFRWRITEVIAWLLSPKNLQSILQYYKHLPSLVRVYILTMFLYFFYTFIIGITMAPMIEVQVKEALEYTHHPLLRTLLESARGFAVISLVSGVIYLTISPQRFEKFIKLFVLSGAVSGLYGLYQASVLQFGLPLPLLAETLFHEGYARPFSTFYEPTGLGSYTAASIFLALYLFQASKGTTKIAWLIVLFLNVLGLLVSLSRAGLLGVGMGVITLAVILGIKLKLWRLILSSILLGIISVPIYFIVHYILAEIMDVGLSSWWFIQSLEDRQEGYRKILQVLLESIGGFGQGLYVFSGAGAAGFFRLVVEGGILGTIFLVVMHISAVLCLKGLLWSKFAYIHHIAPFLTAAYISVIVTTLNYINTTDAWIWFVWSLPAAAMNLKRRILEGRIPSDPYNSNR